MSKPSKLDRALASLCRDIVDYMTDEYESFMPSRILRKADEVLTDIAGPRTKPRRRRAKRAPTRQRPTRDDTEARAVPDDEQPEDPEDAEIRAALRAMHSRVKGGA